MSTQIQLRRDTAADWTSNDPTLAAGEIGWESDTGLGKIGDGSTAWTSLPYTMGSSSLTSYTPTLAGVSLSGGSVTGKWSQTGRLVHFWAEYTWGTGDTFTGGGTPVTFTLPNTATEGIRPGQLLSTITDSGAAVHPTLVGPGAGSTTVTPGIWPAGLHTPSTPDTHVIQNFSSTFPMTWAAGDTVSCSGWYERA